MLIKVRLNETECKWLDEFGCHAGVSTRAGSIRQAVRMLMALHVAYAKDVDTGPKEDGEIQEMFNAFGESERTQRRSRRQRR